MRHEPCERFQPWPEWFDDVCRCGYSEEDHEAEADADERLV